MKGNLTLLSPARLAPLLAAGALALLPLSARADDKGLWTEAEVQKNFGKQFSLGAGVGFRTASWAKEVARWDFSLGATYKPRKFFSLGASYVFLHSYTPGETGVKQKEETDGEDGTTEFKGYNLNIDHAYWRNKHRATFDIAGKVSWGRVTFSLRERYQYTHFNAAETTRTQYKYRKPLPAGMPPEGYSGELHPYGGAYFRKLTTGEEARQKKARDRHYLRSRLTAEWNIRRCAWTPFVSYELVNNATRGEDLHLDKTRLNVGAEWKITKQHRLDFSYVYENGEDDDTDGDTHALCIGYKFKF